ncbi:MAG: glyoxalase [Chlamydiales bacterium 38-26]|nr:VOC family protein [Chlamydiales bacterium]OJV10795.1 MAG: glyoxalase [Chlamydiales bacterium 38-26]
MHEKPKFGEFCWTELLTPHAQAAKDFYGNVFGWEFSDHKMDDSTYTMFKRQDQEFGGIWQIPKDQENDIPPHWLTYILVKNIEESLEKALNYGATVIKPISKAGDFGWMAIIKDPTGAQVALWQALQV